MAREVWIRQPRYTDGTLVAVGDRIRYHQALGGLMSPGTDANGSMWNYGVAVKGHRYDENLELVLDCDAGPYKGSRCHLYSHVIERVSLCN